MSWTRVLIAAWCCLLAVRAPAQTAPSTASEYELARLHMVEKEIAGVGVQNPRVLEAMRSTPRHEFMPAAERAAPISTWRCRSAKGKRFRRRSSWPI